MNREGAGTARPPGSRGHRIREATIIARTPYSRGIREVALLRFVRWEPATDGATFGDVSRTLRGPSPFGAEVMHESRLRALRAAAAVAFGGALSMGCGSTAVEDPRPDAGGDAGGDVAPDAPAPDAPAPDVPPDVRPPDVGPTCSDEADGVCPPGCTDQNDRDCCEGQSTQYSGCTYNPGGGCGCWVEGPFAPPTMRARSTRRAPVYPGLLRGAASPTHGKGGDDA